MLKHATRVGGIFWIGFVSMALWVSPMDSRAESDWTQRFLPRTATNAMPYRLFIPPGYEASGPVTKRYPLILFLHGKGGEGIDNRIHIYNGSRGKIAWLEQGAFIVAPQAATEGGFTDEVEIRRAREVIDEVMLTHRIDPDRVYVTGLSRGGNGTFRMIWLYPDFFAAAVPVCGWGEYYLGPDEKREVKSPWAMNMTNTPIWIFHGTADQTVPATNSQYMYDQIRAAVTESGGRVDPERVKITLYPGVRHNSWDRAYGNPELTRWLLNQRREPSSGR